MKKLHSSLQVCENIRSLINLLSISLDPNNSRYNEDEKKWHEINNLFDTTGGIFWPEMVFIFDEHVKAIAKRMNAQAKNINGSIAILSNKPFMFSYDALPSAQTYSGMDLANFKIHINFGMIHLVSEFSLLIGAFLLGKINVVELRELVQKFKEYLQGNMRLDYQNRSGLDAFRYGRDIDDARFRKMDSPSNFEKYKIHYLEFWNYEDLEFIDELSHSVFLFIIAHEFSHIIIETGKKYKHGPNSSEMLASKFIYDILSKETKSGDGWLEEFACDSMALELCSDYYLKNWSQRKSEMFLKRIGNKNIDNRIALPWICSKAFFKGLTITLGDRDMNSHPKPSNRIRFLEYSMKQHRVPNSVISMATKLDLI